VKTDPRDATTLCQRPSRYLEGNTRELALIRVPSEEEEQARHMSRQREQLVHHRQKLEAQGRSLAFDQPRSARAGPLVERAKLDALGPASACLDHHPSANGASSALEQINALTSELEASAPSILPRGVGKLTSVVLTREICDWHRFNNRRAISSYTGLCPGERSSGRKRVPGSVTKRGNPRVRAALVECAWRMVRFQPQYPPVQKRLAILSKGSRALETVRKKAIVAVARRLAVDLWRLHTGRCTAEQLGFTI
jgi:transposase